MIRQFNQFWSGLRNWKFDNGNLGRKEECTINLGGSMKERVGGVVMIIFGALLGYLCIYQPIESARNGEASVSISLKGALLAPIGLLGLMYLVLGSRVTAIMGTRQERKPASYVIVVGIILLGIGTYIWLRTTLQSYGYDFQGRF
jgi:hypothetical protein